MAPLELKGNIFDPIKQKPNLPPDASKTNYILIECSKPLEQQDYKQLEEAKVFIEEYVGSETYLCHYGPTDLKLLEKLPFVKNAVVYPAKVKMSPDLQQATQSATPQSTMIAIHLHDRLPGGAQKVIEQISAFTKPAIHSQNDELILMTLDLQYVKNIADMDGVRSIGLEHPIKFESTVARGILAADGIPIPPNDTTLNGEGQIITVSDRGFDKGDINDIHPAFTGRVKRLISIGRQATTGQTNDDNGHGTHVCGCAVGNGSLHASGPVRGTAPGAELVVQSLWDPVLKGYNPLSRRDRIDEAVSEGSYIMNCSYTVWGAAEVYDQHSHEIDSAIYRNPEFAACFGAGNEGESTGHINSGAGSKNTITVGASMTSRPLGVKIPGNSRNHFSFDPKGTPGDPGSVAAFSNTGPGANNRIKPDVVAPGVAILSAASRDAAFQPVAEPKSGTTPLINNYGTAPNSLYCYMSGTSMATPLVSGCVAVLRQALIRYRMPNPTASLIKALLIHGARDLKGGTYQGKPLSAAPNNIQGHGLVDMQRSLTPVLDNTLNGIWEAQVTQILQPVIFDFRTPLPAIATQPETYDLSVTLVYTDFPGRKLQSELVLLVGVMAGKGLMYLSATEDNVLKLRRDKIIPGTPCQIKVQASRLWSGRAQKFSVVWSLSRSRQ